MKPKRMKPEHLRSGQQPRQALKRSLGKVLVGMLLLLAFAVLYVNGLAWSRGKSIAPRLLISSAPDRSRATGLDGQSLSGPIYVFVAPTSGSARVTFFLDGSAYRTERHAPFDFNGTGPDGGRPWSATTGGHTIVAKITTKRWAVRTISASFSVGASTSAPAGTTAPASTTAPATTTARPSTVPSSSCTGVRVMPGANLQQVIDASPSGATICLHTGAYRLAQPLRPKANQRLVGAHGAVLNGGLPITSFSRAGATWVADVKLPAPPTAVGVCMPGYTACRYSEAVFYDDRPLWRVTKLSELGSGKFCEDYAKGKVYLADDPNGHRIEVARAKAAIESSATGVVVKGLTVEKFANDAQRGAIVGASGWTIEGNEIRLNHGVGIETPGARNVKVLDNKVHHNGQLGISGWRNTDALYQGNTLTFNNTAGFYNADWEVGGGKWTESSSVTVRNNTVHDNKGVGLWFDINDSDMTIVGNHIRGNDSDGIRYEISYHAVIRDNQIANNGFKDPTRWVNGAGIMVNSARDVEITGNIVADNFNGIMLRQDDRGIGPLGRYVVTRVSVHGNQVTMRRGTNGLSSTTGDSGITSRDNTFERNHYTIIGTDLTNFSWVRSEVAWARWQRYGQDAGGTFTRR
jgi:hypothetical protein